MPNPEPMAKVNGFAATKAASQSESSFASPTSQYFSDARDAQEPREDARPAQESQAEAPGTAALDSLHGEGQRKILDLVDDLRRTGLNSVLQLPQIVVCGDQSAGKSSVLEAISEIPFPRKENFCTRFATEIILRRSAATTIKVRITPDETRPAHKQKELEAFSDTIQHFKELPNIIDLATTAMGIDTEPGSEGNGIARDVLSIEISGPTRPHLTLVDLPGIIHTKGKYQSDKDVESIKGLVKRYISSARAIILAIVSAKNDIANQAVLKYAETSDPKGARTLGIITKPDFLESNSYMEKEYFSLARNENVRFDLGWHILKNLKDGDTSGFESRNAAERAFFSEGNYSELDPENLGIVNLRTRLSRLLHSHLKKELPLVSREVDKMHHDVNNKIAQLGDRRTTVSQQRRYLMEISDSAKTIIGDALRGAYDSSFFGAVDTDGPINSGRNVRRLRAAVQHLNQQFAHRMRRHGSKYEIDLDYEWTDHVEEPIDNEESSEDEADNTEARSERNFRKMFQPFSNSKDQVKPRPLERNEAIDWVIQILCRTRGLELQGSFSPSLIGHLFREQSEPWREIAYDHVDKVAAICHTFAAMVFEHVAAPETRIRILEERVKQALAEARNKSSTELETILRELRRHPMTYNHDYARDVRKIRQMREQQSMSENARREREIAERVPVENGPLEAPMPAFTSWGKISTDVSSGRVKDMDRLAATDALDSQIAFYQDEMKYFVGVVTKQVIERHLVEPLADALLSPMIVTGLSDEEVALLAAEPADVTRQRASLERRKMMLEQAQQHLRLGRM